MAVTIELPQTMSETEADPQLKILEVEPDETKQPEAETQPDEDETDDDETETDDEEDIDPDDTDTLEGTVQPPAQPTVPAGNTDILGEIRRTEAICGELEDEITDQKERLKETKKEYDAACIRLRKLCRSLTEHLPLFDQPAQPTVAEAATAEDEPVVRIARGKLSAGQDPMWVQIIEHPDFEADQIVKVAEFFVESFDEDKDAMDTGDLYAESASGEGEALLVKASEYRILDYYEEDLPERFVIVDSLPIGESKPASDAWRNVPIEELYLDQVKGFGAKKREAFVELCPTIGALEDLRAKAATEHKQFAEMLPKGIGQGLADVIENAVVEWWSRQKS